MPAVPSPIEDEVMSIAPPRRRWTRTETAAMQTMGWFEGQRYELIEGDIVSKMGKNRPHVNITSALLEILLTIFGPKFVQQDAPIDVSPADNPTNEPEPDLIVLSVPRSVLREGNPGPGDLALVCEVSDSTFAFDAGKKARLYARAGIQEYWVIDVQRSRLLVHRQPANGKYESVTAYAPAESVTPLTAPAGVVPVAALFADSQPYQGPATGSPTVT